MCWWWRETKTARPRSDCRRSGRCAAYEIWRRYQREGRRGGQSLADCSDGPRQHARGEAGARSEQRLAREGRSFEHRACSHRDAPLEFLCRTRSRHGSCTRGACTAGCASTSVRRIACWARRWIRRAGRIYQIVQVDEGRLALSDSFVTHIDRCLGCLNCQTACPSGVAYGSLLEQARSQIAENYQRPWLATKLRQHFYAEMLPSFRSPGTPCAVHALLSAIGIAVAGARNGDSEAAGSGGTGCAVAAD